jgi:hypothetical protein
MLGCDAPVEVGIVVSADVAVIVHRENDECCHDTEPLVAVELGWVREIESTTASKGDRKPDDSRTSFQVLAEA